MPERWKSGCGEPRSGADEGQEGSNVTHRHRHSRLSCTSAPFSSVCSPQLTLIHLKAISVILTTLDLDLDMPSLWLSSFGNTLASMLPPPRLLRLSESTSSRRQNPASDIVSNLKLHYPRSSYRYQHVPRKHGREGCGSAQVGLVQRIGWIIPYSLLPSPVLALAILGLVSSRSTLPCSTCLTSIPHAYFGVCGSITIHILVYSQPRHPISSMAWPLYEFSKISFTRSYRSSFASTLASTATIQDWIVHLGQVCKIAPSGASADLGGFLLCK